MKELTYDQCRELSSALLEANQLDPAFSLVPEPIRGLPEYVALAEKAKAAYADAVNAALAEVTR